MTLRSQFALLIVGIVLVPMLMTLIMIFLMTSSSKDLPSFRVTPTLIQLSSPELSPNNYEDISLPQDSALFLYDNQTKSFINKKQQLSGDIVRDSIAVETLEQLLARFAEHPEYRHSVFDLAGHPHLVAHLYYRNSSSTERGLRSDRSYRFILLPLTPLVAMVLFAMAFSLWIIARIHAKIRALELATKEIASGNLDYPITSDGKDKFASLARSLEHMRAQLKKEQQQRSRVLMSISHDLKTPLASIDGYIDALQDGFADTPAKQARFLAIMKEKAAMLTHRIRALIDFAKLTTSDSMLNLQSQSLSEAVRECVGLYQAEAEIQGFALRSSLKLPDNPQLAFDKQLLFRVLENIIDNAMKFSDERKDIHIGLTQIDAGSTDDGSIELRVSNYGSGIHGERLERIFEPFFRESTGRNETGTGLGLASAKHIVEAHGWTIHATSEANGLTSFVIRLPYRPASMPSALSRSPKS